MGIMVSVFTASPSAFANKLDLGDAVHIQDIGLEALSILNKIEAYPNDPDTAIDQDPRMTLCFERLENE